MLDVVRMGNQINAVIGWVQANHVAILAGGVYQGLVLLVVCGSLLSVALRLTTPDAPSVSVRRLADLVAPVVLSWVIAAAVYYGVWMLVLAATGLPVTYVDGYVRMSELASAPTAVRALGSTAQRVLGLVVGTDPTFLGWGVASLLLVWMGTIAAIARALFRAGSAAAAMTEAGSISALLSGTESPSGPRATAPTMPSSSAGTGTLAMACSMRSD